MAVNYHRRYLKRSSGIIFYNNSWKLLQLGRENVSRRKSTSFLVPFVSTRPQNGRRSPCRKNMWHQYVGQVQHGHHNLVVQFLLAYFSYDINVLCQMCCRMMKHVTCQIDPTMVTTEQFHCMCKTKLFHQFQTSSLPATSVALAD